MDPVLKNLIRIGTVVEYPVDPKKHLCRVMFADKPATTSYWLPPLIMYSLENNDYWMPDIGEAVVCIFLPYGHSGQGFILGSYHRRAPSDSPVSTIDRRHIRYTSFKDGTFFEYDRKKHTLTIDLSAAPDSKIIIKANEVTVNGNPV